MVSDDPALADLLAHGGWALGDARGLRAANPDTFWMPAAEQLAQVGPGARVKALFHLADMVDPSRDGGPAYDEVGRPNLTVSRERMWLVVERVEGGHVVGLLESLPHSTHTRLTLGARLRVPLDQLLDVLPGEPAALTAQLDEWGLFGIQLLDEAEVSRPEDPLRPPTLAPSHAEVCEAAGARPERPWPFSLVLVADSVQPDVFPVYGVREAPSGKRDTGWAVWAGTPDFQVAATEQSFERVEVGQMSRRHRTAWTHLALPPGWAFVLGADGYRDVYRFGEEEG